MLKFIKKILSEGSDDEKQVVLFLLSKMEYTSKVKFHAKKYMTIMNEAGITIPRGFNPTLDDEDNNEK